MRVSPRTRDFAAWVHPTEDLVAVCPNCHAMLHRPKGKTLTVDELVEKMKQAGTNSAGG
ncbi:hypothetical protein [Candidatus Poriferisodalis sp.]|uniref:hypothetical protein n=1 Tax=Candidatus Poriferisodalis sp. TaxID=3101277 RepID=UPI003B018991